jgi:hypothetical protein
MGALVRREAGSRACPAFPTLATLAQEQPMTASAHVAKNTTDHDDWRGRLLAEIRRLVREADPEVIEELKWRGATTWSHNGLVCLANIFKDTVKVIFSRGAKLADPDGLFNSELAGNAWRGITFSEKDAINGPAFKRLVRSAIELNDLTRTTKPSPRSMSSVKRGRRK